MRNLQECQAEVFRRSEERIKERKRRRKHILMVCLPLVLCLTVLSGFLLSNVGLGKSTDAAAPETFYAAAGEGITDGISVFIGSVEVSGNGLSHLYTSAEDVQGIIDFIDAIVKTPETNTLSESIDIIADQSTSITIQDDCSLNAYKILIKHSDGTSTEYTLMGPSLTNQVTRETFHMSENTYFALKDLLGIPFY